MDSINVPDLEGPMSLLCWVQSKTMVRCDRVAGHVGLHSWEHLNLDKIKRKSEWAISMEWQVNKTVPGHKTQYYINIRDLGIE